MNQKIKKYVIGVDGGGTKTVAALADLERKILKLAKTGPSNPRNVGIEECVLNVSEAIKKVKGKKKIASIFIGLAAIEEEYKQKKEKIKKEILKRLKNFKGRLEIDSDQIVAFRSGTDEKDGVVLISGTGCVCHGWRGKKEAKTSGWGWLADEGSGFWAGQKGFQAIFKEFDGRGQKTEIKKLVFKKWKLKNKEDLLRKIYSKDSIFLASSISKIIDEAAKMGDKIAILIMKEAGKELAQAAIPVIEKLNFKNEKFPLVLVGRMFESEILLNEVEKEIKKIAKKVKFLKPKFKPVVGAVKLAIENLKKKIKYDGFGH
jgi:N-acetylglucosamine kinase-like BadF-type ATPase